MSVDWRSLRKRIPNSVKLGKTVYEIVYIDEFMDGDTLGETRFEPYQIVIKTGQSDKETVKTFLHEVTHGVDAEEGVGLTETQVLKLEKSLTYLLKSGNIFTEKRKSNAKKT